MNYGQIQGKNFAEISKIYDRLNNDNRHFESSNDICTPLGCVKEMVDSIPPSFWRRKNLKILDSCCGNGNFHAYLQSKVSLDCLHFNEINVKRIDNVRSLFGKGIHLTELDFLSFDDREQFDLIVSNPPYAKINNGLRAAKNHNLSRAFIDKALHIVKPGGYILFIAPDNWMSCSDRNNLPQEMSQYQFRHLNIHGAKHWFPGVGSSFTWFLLQKIPNTEAFKVENHYGIKDVKMAKLDVGVDFIPLYYSDTVRRIMAKSTNKPAERYNVETTSDLHI